MKLLLAAGLLFSLTQVANATCTYVYSTTVDRGTMTYTIPFVDEATCNQYMYDKIKEETSKHKYRDLLFKCVTDKGWDTQEHMFVCAEGDGILNTTIECKEQKW